VFLMDDFKHLWGPGSAWLASYQELFNSPEPELDVYMRVSTVLHCTVLYYGIASGPLGTFKGPLGPLREGSW